jgi:glutamate 5-kinase
MIKTLVVKVGTSSLTGADGRLDRAFIEDLARQIGAQMDAGRQVVLVTSGAIRAGAERMGWKTRPRTVPMKQAAAAVGQGLLMETYAAAFAGQGRAVGQLLLTREDTAERVRYVNARNTLQALFRSRVVPIVNENDTVAVEEIQFGDNDRLAAMVAMLAHAHLLLLLTDVEGVLDGEEQLIPFIEQVDATMMALAGGAGRNGTGGMVTKLQAARMAAATGVDTVIARGRRPDVVADAVAGTPLGTRIPASPTPLQGRKRWIAFGGAPRGAIQVNTRARTVLERGGVSLLPIGIIAVSGHFAAGDTVSLADETGVEFGRGVAGCDASEVVAVMGAHTDQIQEILGRSDLQEIVHRDNLVVTGLVGEC